MSYKLVLQKEAIIDMQEAYTWYEQQKVGLGDSFIEEVEKCFQKLVENPDYSGMQNSWMRRRKLERFPYIIIYEIDSDRVIVNSVFHTGRLPKY